MARPQGSNYQAWLDQIRTKYPDAYAYTISANGWSTLDANDEGPTLTPPHEWPALHGHQCRIVQQAAPGGYI